MDRIATNAAYGSVLSNLMAAEVRQTQAGAELSSQKKATDLKGYAGSAETLAAMQSTSIKVAGFLVQGQVLGDKLATQDQALNQVADAASAAHLAVESAIASGNGVNLMQSLQSEFQNAITGLNATYNGHYVFAGAQVNTPPVSAANLIDLTAAPSIASLFHNDQHVTTNQVDGATTIQSGFLADNVGTGLFTALQNIQAYVNANGPFTGQLTTAQSTFLQGQLAGFDTQHTNLVNVAAQNGLLQTQVTSAQSDLGQQQTMLQGLIGNLTDADLAKASSDLRQAGLAVQAAGQVFNALKASTLLNTLTPGA